MKLWLLTTEFPPQSGGGISTYCRHTASMFGENGVLVTVFIPTRQREHYKIHQESEHIRRVYFRSTESEQREYLGFDAALSYSFSTILKHFQDAEGEPDFIEAQEYLGIAYYSLQRRLLEEDYLPTARFYITAHAPDFLYREYNKAPTYELPAYWTSEMEKSVLRSADVVISPSHYLLKEIEPFLKIDDIPHVIIRNPYFFEEQRVTFTRNDIVFFGKLTVQKGCLELLMYIKEMWDDGFTGTLTVIGGDHFFYPLGMDMGAYIKVEFKNYIAKGLLVLTGHLGPEHIPDRLKAAHIVVVPSLVDNLPYTVLEAMALGKIVLVSEQGGQAELVIHGENGFVFSHQDPVSFRNVISGILALSDDEVSTIAAKAVETIRTLCRYDTVFSAKLSVLQSLKPRTKPTYPYIRPRERLKNPMQSPMQAGLLSIVIPYHNMGSYIEACLQSIMQNGIEKEIIIVNDGSTDPASISMLERMQTQFPVQVVHQRNSGLSQTRNAGAAFARGEYLAFLDADDCVTNDYYKKAIHILKTFDNISFVGCWAKFFGESDKVWPSFPPEAPYFLVDNTLNTSALVYIRTHFLSAGLNDPQMVYGMEDYESTVAMVEAGFQGVVIPEIHWFYRIRKGSMSNKFNRYTEQYLYRLISRKHTAFFSEYARDIVDLLNANGPGMTYHNPTLHSPLPDRLARLKHLVQTRIRSNKWMYNMAKRIYVTFLR